MKEAPEGANCFLSGGEMIDYVPPAERPEYAFAAVNNHYNPR
ncbi:MAG TPA: hypothetical protein PK288_01215 [Bacteroidales bacterium]|nr:hypothetical protein [Bacteroidales bacterium]